MRDLQYVPFWRTVATVCIHDLYGSSRSPRLRRRMHTVVVAADSETT